MHSNQKTFEFKTFEFIFKQIVESLTILPMVRSLQTTGVPSGSMHATVVELDLILKEIKQDNVMLTEHGRVMHHIAESKVSCILSY